MAGLPKHSKASKAARSASKTEVNSFTHDPDAFTQGLVWSNGSLFESTGLYGRSSLRELQLTQGSESGSCHLRAQVKAAFCASWI